MQEISLIYNLFLSQMKINREVIISAIYLLSKVVAFYDYARYNSDCLQCYVQDKARYCLMNGIYTMGTCCHEELPTASCQYQSSNRFCMSKDTIKNGLVGDFTCPSKNPYCPTSTDEVEVKVTEWDRYVERSWTFTQEIPTPTAW